MIGFGFSVVTLAVNQMLGFNPRSLFANGEQGWVYDPSNLSTLFQDAAGTTPVTAMEQPVGLQLDLSGRGNHRRQTTSANRPVVSARVNLLTKTEDFAAWSKTGSPTVTNNAAISPIGTLTAGSINLSSSAVGDGIYVFASQSTASIQIKRLIYLRGDVGGEQITISDPSLGGGSTVTLTTEWQAFSYDGTGNSTTGLWIRKASGNLVYIWGADLRVSNIGVGLPAYQRVNTSTDYDTAGFPVYIKPNGSNQFMVTNSINFSATDKMTVWAGVRKLSDAARGMLIELSSNGSNSSFNMQAPGVALNNFLYASIGNSLLAQASATYAAPTTNAITGISEISSDICILRVNGAQVATSTADQGTGSYGNYPAYFYMRGGASLPFSGHDYGSICRGAASTAGEITSAETWINQRTKAF